jgi:hypothetical protein
MSDQILASVPSALDDLVAAIAAAGVPCTRNPEELNPPAAIVTSPSFVGATLGALSVSVPVYVVTADLGQRGVDELLAMLANAMPVLQTRDATPTLWVGPLNPQGLPAYVVTCNMTIEGV